MILSLRARFPSFWSGQILKNQDLSATLWLYEAVLTLWFSISIGALGCTENFSLKINGGFCYKSFLQILLKFLSRHGNIGSVIKLKLGRDVAEG